MPRRLKLDTKELFRLDLLVIRESDGVWELEWEPLRTTAMAQLFSRVPREALEHALRGWSWPLVSALGLPPEGALHKLPETAKSCQDYLTCKLRSAKDCHPLAKKMPWCFHPAGLPPPAEEAVRLWREKVYVLVTVEDQSND